MGQAAPALTRYQGWSPSGIRASIPGRGGTLPDTWISDLRHGLELLDPSSVAPASARRFWQYLARITLAGSAWYVDTELKTTIRRRRRPQRRRAGAGTGA